MGTLDQAARRICRPVEWFPPSSDPFGQGMRWRWFRPVEDRPPEFMIKNRVHTHTYERNRADLSKSGQKFSATPATNCH